MTPLADIARTHECNIISYTDDTQLILSLTDDTNTTRANFQNTMSNWMRTNCLKLNSDKEVLIFGSNPSPWNDSWWPTGLGPAPSPSNHAHNLGIILDCQLTIKNQVNAVSSSCFHSLRMLGKIFRWIPIPTRKTVP